MAIAVESYSTGNQTDWTAKTFSLTLPSGIQSGELLLILFSHRSNNTQTTPSGWTQLCTRVSGEVGNTIYAKIASGSESTVTLGSTSSYNQGAAIALRLSGATGTIGDISVSSEYYGYSFNGYSPSIDIGTSNSLVVWSISWQYDSTGIENPSDKDYALHFDPTDANIQMISMAYKLFASVGSSGTGQWASSYDRWSSHSICVPPASAGSAVKPIYYYMQQ